MTLGRIVAVVAGLLIAAFAFLLALGVGGAGHGWVEAALLIGLFWAALAHPERIRSITEFRLATLLLGISIVVPVIVQLFLIGNPLGGGMRGNGPAGPADSLGIYAMAISPLLIMMAVILGVDSVTPRWHERDG